jgi:two-component system sensor histidine kinase BaeS
MKKRKLWVQLSMVIGGAFVVTLMMPALIGFIYWHMNVIPASEAGPFAIDHTGRGDAMLTEAEENRIAAFMILTVFGAVIGIGIGSWFSRSLTSPLNDLVKAAQRVGAQDFSYRVEPRGSQEFVEVGRAFNQMAADLDQAEQLRRNLVADVAHELRNPLTLLQGNLRAILDDVYTLDKGEIAMLYDQTRHLTRLVEDLHLVSQAEARQLPLAKERCDLAPILQSVIDVFEPAAEEKGIRLSCDLDQNARATVDRSRLTQVMHNLLSNALRHTPPGGEIRLRLIDQVKTVRIEVEDNGEGMEKSQLAYVFDRFYRADQARARDTGGTGLGLAIVRAIVEAHGGSVSVSSEGPGTGTTVTVEMPA